MPSWRACSHEEDRYNRQAAPEVELSIAYSVCSAVHTPHRRRPHKSENVVLQRVIFLWTGNFAPTFYFGMGYPTVSFKFLSWRPLLAWQRIILGQKLTTTRPSWKIIARCFHLNPYFRARVIRWCHLNFSPADYCCRGNEFWDKINYNSAPVKDNCSLFAPTPLFSGPRYPMVSFKFLPCRPPLLWQRILGQNLL